MVPRLVPEISSLDAFCDTGAVGIGDSRSWITKLDQEKLFLNLSSPDQGLKNSDEEYELSFIGRPLSPFLRILMKIKKDFSLKGNHPHSTSPFPIPLQRISEKGILMKDFSLECHHHHSQPKFPAPL